MTLISSRYGSINLIDKLYAVCLITLMLLNINAPTVLNLLIIKAVFFALCLGLSIILICTKNKISKKTLIVHLLITSALYIPTFIGVVNTNPGSLQQTQVYVLWPWVHFIYLLSIDRNIFDKINKLLVFSGLYLGAYGTIFTINALGVFPLDSIIQVLTIFGRGDEGATSNNGYVEISIAALVSAPYIAPYFFAYFILGGYKKYYHWIILALILVTVILSGRRILWVVVAMSPILIFSLILWSKQIKRIIDRSVIIAIFASFLALFGVTAVISQTFDIQVSGVSEQLTDSVTGTDLNTDSGIRKQQMSVLLDEWSSKPIFGYGFGAVASIVRSDVLPWSYEMLYHSLLFNGGIFLTTLGGIFFLYISSQLVYISRNLDFTRDAIAHNTGFICFLIASATNPYLMRLDGLWVIMFPMALLNIFYNTRIGKSKNDY